jgi:hypothetical protein
MKTSMQGKISSWLHGHAPVLIASLLLAAPVQADVIGQWNFTQGNLSATVGSPLLYLDFEFGETATQTQFGTTTSLGLPDIDGEPASVMFYPSNSISMGYLMPVASAANGTGFLVNDWTMILDLLFPPESAASWRALIETDARLINPDADMFINPAGGLGVSGQYDGQILANTWHRVGMVVHGSAGVIRKYIDGVEVGIQAIDSIDGRWALEPNGFAELFNDNDGDTAPGVVSSIQLRNQALSTAQMIAMGGPAAVGIPTVIPKIPSFIDRWIPAGAAAERDTPIGVVIDAGDTIILDGSIGLRLDGNEIVNPQIIRGGGLITVRSDDAGPFQVGSDHVIEITYTDDMDGEKTASHSFHVALLVEGFESLPLGPNVDEQLAGEEVWTKTPPPGWTIDDSGVPSLGDPTRGVTEWEGWSFADWQWWVRAAEDQRRSEFTNARGTIAIADPDEWDDIGNPKQLGLYNTFLTTRSIDLTGVEPGSVFLKFDSSWRPECCDDVDFANNQTASVTVSYDNGDPITVLYWDSQPASPTFKPDAPNETVVLELANPPGASTLTVTFGLTQAYNDWWWALDNIEVRTGATPPSIQQGPQLTSATEGELVTLLVVAGGTEPLSYQWYRGTGAAQVSIDGATGPALTFDPVTLADDGIYSVEVRNAAGAIFSDPARLIVLESFGGSITDELVLHLTFDQDLLDASGRGNHGTAVGDTPIVDGFIGGAAQYGTSVEAGRNYITLGAPEDLNFGSATDFSISFWSRFSQSSSDPAFLSNKNWGSGRNQGWVVAVNNPGLKWNLGDGTDRADSPGIGALNDGQWHHVAVSFKRNGPATIYLNGEPVDTRDLSGVSLNLDTPAGLATNIGEDGTGAYNNPDTGSPGVADGLMDDLAIWRRAITRDEVTAIYTSGLAGLNVAQAKMPEGIIAGQWDFEEGDLRPTVGGPINYADGIAGATAQQTFFGSTTSFGIPDIEGEEVRVMQFAAATGPMGYLASVGDSNGGEGATRKNVYTLVYDVMWPLAANNTWRSFIQIDDITNGNDGELFVNPANGIGISGQYSGQILPDTWHRVVFVIDQRADVNQIVKYIDGELVGAQSAGGFNGRWGLGPVVNFLSDNDGEVQAGYLSSLQVRNEALSAAEVAALGGATATGIPQVIEVGNQPPIIVAQPVGAYLSPGGAVTLTVGVDGPEPITYRWHLNGVAIPDATEASLVLSRIEASQGGEYTVTVQNSGGTVTSTAALIEIFVGAITDDLVLHLPFDADAADASGRDNHGTLVGQPELGGLAPTFVAEGQQLIGTHALEIGPGQHVTLGRPADLQFGADTDFSIAFWVKGEEGAWTSDPSLVGNKNWGSGSNPGFILAAQGNGGWKANVRGSDGGRRDANGLGVVTDGQWHHLVAVFHRDGLASFYLDGARVSTLEIAGDGDLDALDLNIGNDGTGRYGFDNDTGARFVQAFLDDFGIWRRRLTDQEIIAIHEGGLRQLDLASVVVAPADLRIESLSIAGGQITIQWSAPGVRLERATQLVEPNWVEVPLPDGALSVTEPIGSGNAYYRLVQD